VEYWSDGVLEKTAHGAGYTLHGNTIIHRHIVFSSDLIVCLLFREPCTVRLAPVLQYSILLKLSQEPHVVPVEKLNIVDPVLEHGHPLDSHAEGKPGIDLRVVAHKGVDRRIIHS